MSACQGTSPLALSSEHTRAMVHDVLVPTGEMISTPERPVPDVARFIDELEGRTRSLESLPAEELAQAALGEPLAANTVLLGAALQKGMIPLSVHSLEQAIRERGVAVESNLKALRLGRAVAFEPDLVDLILVDAKPEAIGEGGSPERAREMLGKSWESFEQAMIQHKPSGELEELRHQVAGFASDLVDYQNRAWARQYLRTLEGVLTAEAACEPGSVLLSSAAARELYRLMAYKDEYEVARLHLRGPFRRWLERQNDAASRPTYHLHPPYLRERGLDRKLALGWPAEILFRGLVGMRQLRGTQLDPFGQTQVRCAERDLIVWYGKVLERLGASLSPENLRLAVEVANAPSAIRGYEDLKMARIESVRASVDEKLAAF